MTMWKVFGVRRVSGSAGTNGAPWSSRRILVEATGGELAVDMGEHTYRGEPSAPPLMLLPPSGSSYKVFSSLPSHLPPSHCSRVFGLVPPNGRQSQSWLRVPSLADHAALLRTALQAGDPGGRAWHLLGHSNGSFPLVAGAGLPSPPPIASITMFEPNTFFLLDAGNQQERGVWSEFGGAWLRVMEKIAVGNNTAEVLKKENLEKLNKFLHHFWIGDDWDSAPKSRFTWLTPENVHDARNEVNSILETQVEAKAEECHAILRNLSMIPHKRLLLSPAPGPGSRELLRSLGSLLEREAGFTVEVAPVGGHLGPITHREHVFPVLFQ